MKNNIKKTVRFVALDALERVQKGGAYSNLLLRESINKGQLNEKIKKSKWSLF